MNSGTMFLRSSCVLFATLVGAAMLGCTPAVHSARSSADEARSSDRPTHVYRLDFVLTSGDTDKPPVREQYVMNLAEHQYGDISIGRNVSLDSAGAQGGPAARTDVGLRLGAEWQAHGDDLLTEVRLEVSDEEKGGSGAGGEAIHKAKAACDVLLKAGQPALALRMDDGHKHYDVNVTATRMQ